MRTGASLGRAYAPTRVGAWVLLLAVGTAMTWEPGDAPRSFDPRVQVGGSVRKFVIPEHDLFPESIAYDPVSGDYFLGSMSRSRILRIEPDGTYEDFVTLPTADLESSIGMKVDAERRILWVCTGRFLLFATPPSTPPRTGVLQFDLDGGGLIASWLVSQESDYHICNDIALAADGTAFATTTLIGGLFRVAPDLTEVVREHQLPAGSNNNGIALGPSGNRAFVAVDRGIRRYDLRTGDAVQIEIPEAAGVGPDGLYYHDGSLIMVQPRSNQVVQLALDDAHEAVEGFRVLARDHPDFAYPTTGVVVGDTLVFVASSYANLGRTEGAREQHGDVFIHAVPLR